MKNTLSILLLLLCITVSAQPGKGRPKRNGIRDRIKAERVAFITERLALTSEEAQRFWPVYNEFTDQFESIKKRQRDNRSSTNNKLAIMTDKEVEKSLADELVSQQQMVDLQRQYQQELLNLISVKKIAMLYKAEHDFKLELLKKMKESGQRPPPDDDF
jgi:hypothetical protein